MCTFINKLLLKLNFLNFQFFLKHIMILLYIVYYFHEHKQYKCRKHKTSTKYEHNTKWCIYTHTFLQVDAFGRYRPNQLLIKVGSLDFVHQAVTDQSFTVQEEHLQISISPKNTGLCIYIYTIYI